MPKKYKIIGLATLIAAFLLIAGIYLTHTNIPVLEPAGSVGLKERNLIFVALSLSVIVVVPTFALTVFIVWKYRENNHRQKKYNPDWDHSRLFESIWWGVPTIIITILSVVTWNSAHALDPYKAIGPPGKTLTIEVVALDWKWLFIYPGQNVASVNQVDMPVNVPVDFEITSDSVMNSFWIPQLGGQIYAMPGMNTQLHLMAYKTGSFYGSPANIAGDGFARMTFTAKADSLSGFKDWVTAVAKQSTNKLDSVTYARLAKPSESVPVTYFSAAQAGLFQNIIDKYMGPDMITSGAALNGINSTGMSGMYRP